MGIERELKLVFAPEAAGAVRRSGALRGLKRGRSHRRELESVYFDTARRTLWRAGVALRLRRDGDRWIQTLKGGGSASGGLHVREEREWPLVTNRLDPSVLAGLPPFNGEDGIDAGELVPVFTTRFERTSFNARLPDATLVEVAIDAGTIECGSRTEPIHEIEIELKSGGVDALFTLAGALVDELPLSIGLQSKAERGYRLADRARSGPSKARRVDLQPEQTASEAARAVIAECLRHLQANESGLLTGRDPEYLHQMRVALRRLRAALATFRQVLPVERAQVIRAEARMLAEVLGAARDWDVWLADTLGRHADALRSLVAFDAIERRSRRMRQRARRAARDFVRSARYTRLVLDLARLLAAVPFDASAEATPATEASATSLASARIDRLHQQLERAAASLGDSDARHAARIAAKKLRYNTEFFASLFRRKRTERYLTALEQIQESLGTLNDHAVGIQLLGRLSDAGDPPDPVPAAALRGWLAGAAAVHLESVPAAFRDWQRAKVFW